MKNRIGIEAMHNAIAERRQYRKSEGPVHFQHLPKSQRKAPVNVVLGRRYDAFKVDESWRNDFDRAVKNALAKRES